MVFAPISFKKSGTSSSSGVIPMANDPDLSRGRDVMNSMPVGAFSEHNATVQISGTATVEFQGCNGDPSVASNWVSIASATSTGTLSSSEQWEFTRFNVTSYTSGTITVDYLAMVN